MDLALPNSLLIAPLGQLNPFAGAGVEYGFCQGGVGSAPPAGAGSLAEKDSLKKTGSDDVSGVVVDVLCSGERI